MEKMRKIEEMVIEDYYLRILNFILLKIQFNFLIGKSIY